MTHTSRRLIWIAMLALAALSFAGCDGCDKRQPPVTRLHDAAAHPGVALCSPCGISPTWS